MTSTASRRSGAEWIWRVLAGLALLWLCAWPLLSRMAIAMDDVQLMVQTQLVGNLRDALALAWRSSLFRPLLTLSAFLFDIETRTGPLVTVLQSLSLALAIIPLWKLSAGDIQRPISPWLVCALWLLHPAVSVSLWQMDTVSQTASAAAGLWLVALATNQWAPQHRGLWWPVLVLLGILTKETFLGWIPVAVLLELRTQRRLRPYVLGAAAAAGLFVWARLSILGPSVIASGEERYAIHLDASILKNLGVLVSGGLAYGPVHALRLLGVTSPSWWAAALGMGLHALILATAMYRSPAARREVSMLWGLALVATSPVLLMGHVSELYLMGPNAFIALALAASVESLIEWRRLQTCLALGALLVCSAWGLASRSYHFGLTWQYSRALAAQVFHGDSQSGATSNWEACAEGFQGHSVYVVSPLKAFARTGLEVDLSNESVTSLAWKAKVDCTDLPERRRW